MNTDVIGAARRPEFTAQKNHHHHDHHPKRTRPGRYGPSGARRRGVIVKSWERSHAITAARGLTPPQKATLYVIADHCNGDDKCKLGLRRIADEVGVALNTASVYIAVLERLGWLEGSRSHSPDGTAYRFTVPPNAAKAGPHAAPAPAHPPKKKSDRARRFGRTNGSRATVSTTETPSERATVSTTETPDTPELSLATSANCLWGGGGTVSAAETKRDLNGIPNGMVGDTPSQDNKASAHDEPTIFEIRKAADEERGAHARLDDVEHWQRRRAALVELGCTERQADNAVANERRAVEARAAEEARARATAPPLGELAALAPTKEGSATS